MVWIIFKKDFRLLWPVAVLVTALQAGFVLYTMIKGPFRSALWVANEESWLSNSVLIGAAALAVLAVQQDPLPGVEADWLVRPIRRSRLLLAKLLFMAVTLHVPIFLLDMLVCHLADGDLGPSVGASLSRNLLFLCGITLPLLGAAAITKNIATFVAVVFLYHLSIDVIQTVLSATRTVYFPPFPYDNWGGSSWITTIGKYIVLTLGAVFVLALQYFRRKTIVSWIVLPLFLLGGFLVPALPWQAAFGIQQMLSPVPAASQSVSLSFAPDSPRVRRNPKSGEAEQDTVQIFVPIQIAGLTDGTQLFVDHHAATMITSEGEKRLEEIVSSGTTAVNADGQPINAFRPFVDTAAKTYVPLGMSRKDLTALSQSGITLVVDYAFTLGEKDGEDFSLYQTKNFVAVPRWGQCRTDIQGITTQVQCVSVGKNEGLNVVSAFTPDSERPYASEGGGYYSPTFASLLPDALYRDQAFLSLFTSRPSAPQLVRDTRFVFTHYRPLAHFRYRLEIHDLKLADWVMLPSAE